MSPYRTPQDPRPKCTKCYGDGHILDWDGMGSSSIDTCGRCGGNGLEPEPTPKRSDVR